VTRLEYSPDSAQVDVTIIVEEGKPGDECQAQNRGAKRDSGGTALEALFVNGRYIADAEFAARLEKLDSGLLLIDDGTLVAVLVAPDTKQAKDLERLDHWGYGHFKEILKSLPKMESEASHVKYIWDFVRLNPQQITADFDAIVQSAGAELVAKSATVENQCLIHAPDRVFIGAGVVLDGQSVIDAREGPVYIDDGGVVEPHSQIVGPCYIGKKSMIVGGKIREGCSIGPVCKVGGELEESIILGYSNKFHDGFLGHAYLGEWVNLGADTTNSDLKNNYGTIRVDLGFGQTDTGMIKVGSFIGDHVKTGIGTLLNTGISIGFATNVFGGGLVSDKHIPPYCWGGTGKYAEYLVEKAISTATVR